VPRSMFQKILGLIDDPRARSAPAWAEEIDGGIQAMGELRRGG